MATIPYIPESITVHLAAPNTPAENVTLPFSEYIKKVASAEIYPTWPENALIANIYAIISFALNRVYTEWYTSKGYDFDITSSTAYDQAFNKDQEIFENISLITDNIFNNYIVRNGSVQPLFAQFCNGTTTKCNGLSQWGTVDLANKGYSPIEILKYYYGNNISIIYNAPIMEIERSYPGKPLKLGDAGNDVWIFQQQLNRLSQNFPAIPYIENKNGIFDVQTQNSVKKFQEIFNLPINGTVDKATWYKIKEKYIGVKRLSELISEGLTYDEIAVQYPSKLSVGMKGYAVTIIQYYLNVIAYFNNNLNLTSLNGDFDSKTENAVKEFQAYYGIPITGEVDKLTYNTIQNVYIKIIDSLPDNYSGNAAKLYPGYFLSIGSTGSDVRDLQTYLNVIGKNITEIDPINVDGIFGNETRNAVLTFQELYGLPKTGAVGPILWNEIAKLYDLIIGAKYN